MYQTCHLNLIMNICEINVVCVIRNVFVDVWYMNINLLYCMAYYGKNSVQCHNKGCSIIHVLNLIVKNYSNGVIVFRRILKKIVYLILFYQFIYVISDFS